jgi:hypothetical protein
LSRETDSPSSGPQGRGGAAYPSGTQPYGTRPFPSLHPQERPQDGEAPADAAAPAADEPRTETTLTTRVRINIPGSRPIPPVVVRTTVEGAGTGAGAGPGAMDGESVQPAAETTALPPGWSVGGGSVPAQAASAAPASAAPVPAPAAPPAAADGGKPPSDWFAPRRSATPAYGTPMDPAPAPQALQAAEAPDATQPMSLDDIAGPPPATGQRPSIPYLNDPASDGDRTGPFGSPVGYPPGPRNAQAGGPTAPSAADPGAGTPFPSYQPPAGPTSGPVTGEMRLPAVGPAGPAGPPPGRRSSGDTLVSGIPAVPAGAQAPAAAVTKPQPAAKSKARAKKKGRSKFALLVGLLIFVGGGAYSAGLLMDHADVPAGTTVLGIEIGGKSKDEAVKSLNTALGDLTTQDITLKVGTGQQKLKPAVSGLGLDFDTTVRNVAHRDYNPVTVIGSLFGGTRAAQPAWVTDEEKLTAMLGTLADQSSGSGSDGMIKFVAGTGQAIAVPGKAHQSLDAKGSVSKVIAAYEQRALTGQDTPVVLSVTTVQPKVTQAKLNAALNGFAKTAMSGIVTLNAGGHQLRLGHNSLPQFLTMVSDGSGNLTPHFDLPALKAVMSTTFDGVLLQRGNGTKTAVTPQDVVSAILPALNTQDQTKKIVTFPNIA